MTVSSLPPSSAPTTTPRSDKVQTAQKPSAPAQETARQAAPAADARASQQSSFETAPGAAQARLTGGNVPQVPSDPYQYALMAMDVTRAAKTLLQNYDAVERVGMDGRGKGSGDANIGRKELERVAEGSNGLPPEVRAAARWMLDHPIATRSIDQGASSARGGNDEYHFSRGDLQEFTAAMPTAPSGESRSPIYQAARTLRDHYQFVEGVGMDATGRGARDANIGMSELRRAAQDGSGAPPEVQAAIRLLLADPATLKAIDTAASRWGGVANEVHMSKQDLDAFLATEPPAPTEPTEPRTPDSDSMLVNTIITSGTENRDPTKLTETQRKMLETAGYKEGSDEWKQGKLKFQIQNLSQALTSASEFGQTYSEMRKKSTDGTSR